MLLLPFRCQRRAALPADGLVAPWGSTLDEIAGEAATTRLYPSRACATECDRWASRFSCLRCHPRPRFRHWCRVSGRVGPVGALPGDGPGGVSECSGSASVGGAPHSAAGTAQCPHEMGSELVAARSARSGRSAGWDLLLGRAWGRGGGDTPGRGCSRQPKSCRNSPHIPPPLLPAAHAQRFGATSDQSLLGARPPRLSGWFPPARPGSRAG